MVTEHGPIGILPPTRILGAEPSEAKALCVVVHGRGQSAVDMEAQIVSRLSIPQVRYVLPQAGNARWYAARAVEPMTSVTRLQLDSSLAVLDQAIQEARQAAPRLPLLLAGFSQGACLVA